MTKWAYLVLHKSTTPGSNWFVTSSEANAVQVNVANHGLDQALGVIGALGWELVSASSDQYLFKQPITD